MTKFISTSKIGPFESKYQLLIERRENLRIITLKNPEEFIDSSKTIDDVYKNLEDYNLTKKRKVLIMFSRYGI